MNILYHNQAIYMIKMGTYPEEAKNIVVNGLEQIKTVEFVWIQIDKVLKYTVFDNILICN